MQIQVGDVHSDEISRHLQLTSSPTNQDGFRQGTTSTFINRKICLKPFCIQVRHSSSSKNILYFMKKFFTIMATLLTGTAVLFADPFEHEGIYYQITSPTTVEVAEAPDGIDKNELYKGAVTVPPEIEYQGKTYKVNALGVGAFCNTLKMTSLQLPETIDSIKQWAFTRCAITVLDIPASVTYIGNYIGSGSSIEKITGMENVKEFGKTPFWGMHYLNNLCFLPMTLETVPDNPFVNCESLASITVHPGNPNFMSYWGCIYTKSKKRLISVPGALAQGVTDGRWTLPAETKIIGKEAFVGNHTITTITIPENVKTIEALAFMGSAITTIEGFQGVEEICDSGMEYSEFTSLKLGPAFRKMGKSAFWGGKIQSLDMSEVTKLETIEETALAQTDLTSIRIPACVKNIVPSALNYNESLTVVEVDPGNTVYASRDNVIYSKDFKELCLYPGALPQNEFTVPAGVTSIGSSAFCSANNLTKVTLSDECETLGADAFSSSKNLKEVVFKGNLTTVGDEAFQGTGIEQIFIPAKWDMGKRVFTSCRELKDAEFEEGRKILPQETFYKCIKLNSVALPESLETIGAAALGDCFSLTQIVVPDNVTTVGEWAFSMLNGPSGYTQLTTVILGEKVNYIGEQCFAGTSTLEEIYSLNPTPPAMHDGFVPITFSEATLYVPENSLEAYKSAAPWSSFSTIETIPGSGVEDIEADGTVNDVKIENGQIIVDSDAMVEIYTATGQMVYSGTGCSFTAPASGIYIVRVNGKPSKVVL